jgi:4-diphosphocytidyl-2-C-methyl-D-erythritol kinase
MVLLAAPAKVTLALRITGRRSDGYHLIDAEMVTVDLVDVVELELCGPDERTSVTVSPAEPDGSVGGFDAVPVGADNLVVRALDVAEVNARVTLRKRIAAGAGLGGGSADAAAVLRWAGRTDLDEAAGLGADVPFCVVGGRARVSGIGEVVDPLDYREETLTLLTPPFGCSTPAVYAAWDEMGGPSAEGPNDLEPAALVVEPRLGVWRDELAEATGEVPLLAGSGSTWFVRGDYPGPGRVVVRTVPAGWHPAGTDG